MSERNIEAMHAFFAVWNSGDLDSLDEVMAEDFVDHDAYNPSSSKGLEGAKEAIATYRAGFSDLEMTIDDTVAVDDVVVVRWTANGTHDGDVMGLPPTGNRGRGTHGISWTRFEDGKAVENWTQWDVLGFMQDVGAMPAGEQAAAG